MLAKLVSHIVLIALLIALVPPTGVTAASIPLFDPPGNDNFANAQTISGNSGRVESDNQNATREDWEPNHTGVQGGASIWYRWTAPASSELTFNTAGSNFDTLLAVYTWPGSGPLNTVAGNDDVSSSDRTSRVTFGAVAGTEYFIAIDGYRGSTGNLVLSWNMNSASLGPQNDNFVRAAFLDGAFGSINGTNAGATKENWEPDHVNTGGGASIWYYWVAPDSSDVTFDTMGSNFDTLLAVYTWQGAGYSLKAVVGNDDESSSVRTSRVTFRTVAGTKYYIAVDGYRGAQGLVSLNRKSSLPVAVPVIPVQSPTPEAAPSSESPVPLPGGVSGTSARPSNVDDQFSSTGSPLTAACLDGSLRAGSTNDLGSKVVPHRIDLCFDGFRNDWVSVQLFRPDGKVRPPQPARIRITDDYTAWKFVVPLEDPLGTYTVKATQGTLSAVVTFRLVRANTPQLIVDPDVAQVGAQLRIYVGGFPRNSPLTLNLYRPVQCQSQGKYETNRTCYGFQKSLRVRTDSNGQGTYSLQTSRNDAANTYVLRAVYSAQVQTNDWFRLTR